MPLAPRSSLSHRGLRLRHDLKMRVPNYSALSARNGRQRPGKSNLSARLLTELVARCDVSRAVDSLIRRGTKTRAGHPSNDNFILWAQQNLKHDDYFVKAQDQNSGTAQNQTAQPQAPRHGSQKPEVVVTPVSDTTLPSATTTGVIQRDIVYVPGSLRDNKFDRDFSATVSLIEVQTGGNSKPVINDKEHKDSSKGGVEDNIAVANTKSNFQVAQRFTVNGNPVRIARMDTNGKISLASKQIVNATATKISITAIP